MDYKKDKTMVEVSSVAVLAAQDAIKKGLFKDGQSLAIELLKFVRDKKKPYNIVSLGLFLAFNSIGDAMAEEQRQKLRAQKVVKLPKNS